MDARVAGVYLFERLARDSPSEHDVIFTVLVEFVRNQTPIMKCERAGQDSTGPGVDESKQLSPDIRAALTAIGRRDTSHDAYRDWHYLNLSGLCLSNGAFLGAKLAKAVFSESNLHGANFFSADLAGVNFNESNLSHASLSSVNAVEAAFGGVDLSGANLTGAKLDGANFFCTIKDAKALPRCANLAGAELDCYEPAVRGGCASLANAALAGADLTSARLSGANLTAASLGCVRKLGPPGEFISCTNLTNADLAGANLTRADLAGANLTNIYYDSSTIWPTRFIPPASRPTR
ncbi:hypothetical protein GCM10027088_74040 [Nocardia goodfellowii]